MENNWVLGIESTAHTLSFGGIYDSGLLIPSSSSMIKPEEGGIHPREAADHHADIAGALLKKFLQKNQLNLTDMSSVSFSQGPGLGPCLRIGASIARSLSSAHNIPLIGVNHCVAHIEIGRLECDCDDPVLLYVSGGNTQVISKLAGKYRVLGETLDIGIGNMLDKFARVHGYPFPGGPIVEIEADKWRSLNPDVDLMDYSLPYAVHGMDLAFSGTMTAAVRSIANGAEFGAVCWSLQEHVFAACIEVAERALAHTGKTELLLGGGVACNSRINEMSRLMCQERGAMAFTPANQYCVDNGTMIAVLGKLTLDSGYSTELEQSAVNQKLRTDHTRVTWS